MKIVLETHMYAPELNKAFLNGRTLICCPCITSINELRAKFFKRVRVGKYSIVKVTNEDHPCVNKEYKGYIKDYLELRVIIKRLKMKHNLHGTVFTVKTKLVG